MNVLFIHQNFPGQFKNLAPALVQAGHRCVSLTLRVKEPQMWNGVQLIPYAIKRPQGKGVHPWLVDTETKVIRAEACWRAAPDLKAKGFTPDLIVGHHGWGEPMFLRDVWPNARIGLDCELYHRTDDGHMGFDPKFQPVVTPDQFLRIRMKNLNNLMHLPLLDAGISPTHFQADTFPAPFREKISVIHDGIDTDMVKANPDARFATETRELTRQDEVITFVNRNLEPYRGCHVFMRALPRLLKEPPKAEVLIVGGDEVSYGAKPPGDKSWKQIFIDEVRGQISDADWARVHFLGRIPYDRFLALLQVSRVHVYLTYPFVLSWSFLEAMASEAAIVASDTALAREAITDGKTGLLVDFFNRDALVEKICATLEDAELRKEMGRAAREHVVKTYDLKRHCLPAQMQWIENLARLEPGKASD